MNSEMQERYHDLERFQASYGKLSYSLVQSVPKGERLTEALDLLNNSLELVTLAIIYESEG